MLLSDRIRANGWDRSKRREMEPHELIPLRLELTDAPSDVARRVRAAAEGKPIGRMASVFGNAYRSRQRVAAFYLAKELTARGVPPSLRDLCLDRVTLGPNERFDLFVYDALWIARRYPEQVDRVLYQQSRQLFREATFHRAAEFAYYGGRRTMGQIVGAWALTEAQQWECSLIRSRHIARQADAIASQRPAVRARLRETIYAARNKSFDDSAAAASLTRREHLWLCSQMFGKSPSEVARRYEQMTGEAIGRNLVAKQLEAIDRARG